MLMAPAGQLKFPLTGQYDNNLDCTWKISAPFGTVIKSAAFNCQFIPGAVGIHSFIHFIVYKACQNAHQNMKVKS